MTKIDHCEHIKLTLIANAAALQHCEGTAANVIPLPGTDRFIAIGTPAEVARLLEIAPAPASTASIDLAQLDKLRAEIRRLCEREDVQPFNDLLNALARRSLTSGAPAEVIAWYADVQYDLNEDKQGDWTADYRTRRSVTLGADRPRTKDHWKPLVDAAPIQATSGAPLDKDEMTRLRRLMKALGYDDAFQRPDDYVRGVLCPILGQAAMLLEGVVHDAAAPSNDAKDEAARLRKVLVDVRHALQFANDTPRGGISDTLWMMHGPETVFDFIDNALSAGAAAKTEQAPMQICPRCQGSGEGKMLVGGGPDAYEIDSNCDECGGIGEVPATAAGAGSAQPSEDWRLNDLTEQQKLTISAMDSWALAQSLPAYSTLVRQARAALTQQAGAAAPSQEDAAIEKWISENIDIYFSHDSGRGLHTMYAHTDDIRLFVRAAFARAPLPAQGAAPAEVKHDHSEGGHHD